MDQKKELGKGIRALLGNMESGKTNAPKPSQNTSAMASVQMIPLAAIEGNPYQPRNEFDAEALRELASTIKLHGIIQPITVRKIHNQKYQLIAGERRTRASRMAGLQEIPAFVRSTDDQGMLEMALIENIQRENLNAMEVAISMARLIEECKLTHEQMSERLGKERSTVSNYIRLLKLPPDIHYAVKSRTLSMGHARALAGIEHLVLQIKLFKETILHQWSVRQLEQTIKSYQKAKPVDDQKSKNQASNSIQSYVDKANGIFGRRILIKADKKGKGNLLIPFASLDELDELLDRLD